MVCSNCKEDKCEACIDRLRAIYSSVHLCECKRKLHAEKRDGEPTSNQVEDPFTGNVEAPGLTVNTDGTVTFRDGFNPFE